MTEGTHSIASPTAASLQEIAIVEQEGQPLARDVDVGERLGLQRPRVIRELIERNRGELEGFGPLAVRYGKSRGQEFEEFLLNEEQALLVATLSSAPNAPAVRAMLIRTFVAWRRGHLAVPAHVDMGAIGGVVKGVVAKQLAEHLRQLLPMMVREQVAEQQHSVVRGVSAGQVLAMAGLSARKGLRGMAPWVSHRLRRFHAQKGAVVRMASLGSSQAYVFDPLVARQWLVDGGRAEIEQKAAEKRGQGKLPLVEGPRP
ncbi:hypothetical protein [Methylorubrum extorquens]|uniref:Antirepressor protein C-terminal domain-containing protein n=1 Tax=Methylorubrum extorquens (strain CM4 / NCIMB 13688) TaxID=440085 RepID=B7KSX6_METC4|nr:hypothetical protein [Methylorubrum extorquens]ACK82478.1 conserved hypothetical protein [Methylorubrum extorquens CM4]